MTGDDRRLPGYHSDGQQQRLHRTAAHVTHDQSEVLAVSGRIIVIDDRLIFRRGTPKDRRERPASESVAGFMGEAMRFAAVAKAGGWCNRWPQAGSKLRRCPMPGPVTMILDSSVGRARVGRWRRVWVGATTTRAPAR